MGTSAESPAEAFVKRLFNPSPASQSKTEELLRERFAAAEARAAAELAAAESRATAAEEGLASFKESATSAESRAASASAEASLAASTTQVKDSALALEIEDLRERNSALEAAVQHRRLHFTCEYPNNFARTAALLKFLGYDPLMTTDLRVPLASLTRGAARERPLVGTSTTSRSPARFRPRSVCSRR